MIEVGKKEHYYWSDIDKATDNLAQQILELYIKPLYICGIPRGGLIPAVLLSHKTGISYFDAFRFSIPGNGHVLVVDDICDSGKTLQHLEYKTAVLHYKPHTSIIEPTFYACKFESDDWIVYPWENKDSKTIQDYKILKK